MINPRNLVNGSLGYQRTSAENPNLFAFVDDNRTMGMNLNVSWRHTFNKTLFGTLSANFSRLSARSTPFFANRLNVSGEAGIAGNNQDPQNWGPPSLNFDSGFAGLNDSQESFTRNQTSAASYRMLWMKRPHNFTIGGDMRRIQQQSDFAAGRARQLRLHGRGDAGGGQRRGSARHGTTSRTSCWACRTPARSPSATPTSISGRPHYDAYFTDDWRVSAGLTLNVGRALGIRRADHGAVRPPGESGHRSGLHGRRRRCWPAIRRAR